MHTVATQDHVKKLETDRKTTVRALLAEFKECSKTQNLEWGQQIHAKAVEWGCDSSIYVGSALIHMYAKCGSMSDALQVFDSMKHQDVVTWNALIMGYADSGEGLAALDLLTRMKCAGTAPNSVTFLAALKACTSLEVGGKAGELVNRGKGIHNLAVDNGCTSDIFVQNTLIDMYAKCGSMPDARQIFDGIKHPCIVSWNALILGYADTGEASTAFNLFKRMKSEGFAPNPLTFLAVLGACASSGISKLTKCRDWGVAVHVLAVQYDCYLDIYVQNSLIDMYSKCGSMVDAHLVFECLKHRNVVSWAALILGYAESGEGLTGLKLFTKMRNEGVANNSVSFVAALKSCASFTVKEERARCRDQGKAIHNLAVENGWDSNLYVQNTLIDMYTKCGSTVDARRVFDSTKNTNLVSWNALMLGYADGGEGVTALDLFARMRSQGLSPDSVTFMAALKACSSLAVQNGASGLAECRERGKEIHDLAVAKGCDSDKYMQNTLIDMYANCGSMVEARQVFNSMINPDVVSWTALIMGYADNGEGLIALDLFTRMKDEGLVPDYVAFAGALKACALLGALDVGRMIHSEIRCEINDVLVNSLVDFYAKCGSLVEAQSIFDLHPETRDLITWNALLAGFSVCGDIESVFRLFKGMEDACVQPDAITFLFILTCCCHTGLVDKAKQCFDAMPSTKYGIVPNAKHYNCMIDMLGRAKRLDDSVTLLRNMPSTPDDVTWMTIMGACCQWKNVEIGRLAFQSLINFNDRDAVGYVLMGHLYGSRGMLQEQEMVMAMRTKIKGLDV